MRVTKIIWAGKVSKKRKTQTRENLIKIHEPLSRYDIRKHGAAKTSRYEQTYCDRIKVTGNLELFRDKLLRKLNTDICFG